jgi:peptidoglycan hydrolase-like protein with peptidoglycan-binding domain
MRIALSSGHGEHIRGASGNPVPPQLEEVTEARRAVERVCDFLAEAEVECETFHDDVSTTQSQNLDRIVNWHNDQDRELDVSIHFNAFDGNAHGTEVLYLTQEGLARAVCDAICDAGGFTNRGPKYRSDLAFLNGTNEPAILIEVCFCDNTDDSNLYHEHFDDICRAIAEVISGQPIGEAPPDRPERPERPQWPDRPESIPVQDRPTLRQGDEGQHVLDMQRMIPRFTGEFDGNFGPTTNENVIRYQTTRGLDADGICGQATWESLYRHALPVPPPPPPPGALTPHDQAVIMKMAAESQIADYSWRDRGVGPAGWIMGLSLAFAQSYLKLKQGHPAVERIARANTHDDDDVCQVYRDEFDELDMSNEIGGPDVLRHIYAFLIGMAMRESSGQHCCGRDQSADNYDETTCEAGMFQQSYNSFSCDSTLDPLMDEYSEGLSPGYLEAFSTGVSCSSDDWQNFGDPDSRGYEWQALAKNAPAFSAEACAVGLRVLKDHWGPVKRKEVELRRDADDLLKAVQLYVDSIEPTA